LADAGSGVSRVLDARPGTESVAGGGIARRYWDAGRIATCRRKAGLRGGRLEAGRSHDWPAEVARLAGRGGFGGRGTFALGALEPRRPFVFARAVSTPGRRGARSGASGRAWLGPHPPATPSDRPALKGDRSRSTAADFMRFSVAVGSAGRTGRRPGEGPEGPRGPVLELLTGYEIYRPVAWGKAGTVAPGAGWAELRTRLWLDRSVAFSGEKSAWGRAVAGGRPSKRAHKGRAPIRTTPICTVPNGGGGAVWRSPSTVARPDPAAASPLSAFGPGPRSMRSTKRGASFLRGGTWWKRRRGTCFANRKVGEKGELGETGRVGAGQPRDSFRRACAAAWARLPSDRPPPHRRDFRRPVGATWRHFGVRDGPGGGSAPVRAPGAAAGRRQSRKAVALAVAGAATAWCSVGFVNAPRRCSRRGATILRVVTAGSRREAKIFAAAVRGPVSRGEQYALPEAVGLLTQPCGARSRAASWWAWKRGRPAQPGRDRSRRETWSQAWRPKPYSLSRTGFQSQSEKEQAAGAIPGGRSRPDERGAASRPRLVRGRGGSAGSGRIRKDPSQTPPTHGRLVVDEGGSPAG